MDLRTTSAGYRLPHQKKLFNPNRQTAARQPTDSGKILNIKDADAVKINQILTKQIDREWKAVKIWQENWSFLTEYDYYGRKKPAKELPTSEAYYDSGKVPLTQSATYGCRQNSENSKSIMKYQTDMGKPLRRKSLGSEFQCY